MTLPLGWGSLLWATEMPLISHPGRKALSACLGTYLADSCFDKDRPDGAPSSERDTPMGIEDCFYLPKKSSRVLGGSCRSPPSLPKRPATPSCPPGLGQRCPLSWFSLPTPLPGQVLSTFQPVHGPLLQEACLDCPGGRSCPFLSLP